MSINSKMTAIADAIRDKTGETEPLSLDDMALAIPIVYDAGKQAEYNEFWNLYQKKGARTDYRYAFWNGDTWSAANFKPKYDIKPVDATNMLYNTWLNNDLVEWLAITGVILDFSNTTTATNCFAYSSWKRIGELNCSKLSTASYMCNNATQLQTIDKIIFTSSTNIQTTAFQNCSKLANVTVEGTIYQNISFNWSPLTVESMISIIEHLKDYTDHANANTRTVKFTSACWTKLNAETPPEGYATWQDYVTQGLKWLV